jgi:hypothetical protein
MIRLLISLLLLSVPSLSEAADRKWWRRAAAIGACAASAADAYSTLRLNQYARTGLVREANPLFARPDGSASPVRLISIKAPMCAAGLLSERWFKRDELAIGGSLAQIAAYSFATTKNVGHLSRMQARIPARPATLAVPIFELSDLR